MEKILIRLVKAFTRNNHGSRTSYRSPMNIIRVAVFVSACSLWKRGRACLTMKAFCGNIGLTVTMIKVLNIIYAVPLKVRFANFDINKTYGMCPKDHD